jgi:hypothetical protein
MNRQDILSEAAQSAGRTRKTTARLVEGKAGTDAPMFENEEISFRGPDMTMRSVKLIISRTCSAGHLTDDRVHMVGVCEVCLSYTCSTEGCSFTCHRCGRALCARHAHVLANGEACCARCWPLVAASRFLRWFFGVGDREKK